MSASRSRNAGPDRAAALEQYRRRASVYDLELALFEPVRRRAVAWLAPQAGDTVLDVGCGSGILAVAALRLGAATAVGVDIDPQAEIATRENAERNGVAAQVSLHAATPPWPGAPYDFTLANILAGPLVELAPDIAAATRTGGGIVLAGLLAAQAAEVMAAYEPHFTMMEFGTVDGWTCLAGRRRGI